MPALAPAARESGVVYIAQPLDRPEDLPGRTYKIKWPGSDHAIYITINDVMQDGRRRPFEIFINSKNMEHYAWTVALTRMISAVFRRGGDVSFVVEELKAVFDPRGGQWMEGRYVPSLLAAIGGVIERHLIEIGFLAPADQPRITEAAEQRLRLAAGAREAGRRGRGMRRRAAGPGSVPELRRRRAHPSGRLRRLPQLRLLALRLDSSLERASSRSIMAMSAPDQPSSSWMPADLLTSAQIAAKSPTNLVYSAGLIGLASGSSTTSLKRSTTSGAL